ncbi:Methyltransferase [Gammaproteobacteria bacterium]
MLLYLTTTGAPLAWRMGYTRELVGIRARWKRCRDAWSPHLTATRNALIQSAMACHPRRRALLLGAGALHDIPLAELATHFTQVDLVDLIFLPHTRWQAYRLGNVRCIVHDVTDALTGDLLADRPVPRRFTDEPDIDWVASVNLWSQLSLLPVQALRQRHPDWPEVAMHCVARRLMQRHLDYLMCFSAPVCLIADRLQVSYQASGEVLEQSDFGSQFPLLQKAQQVWRWDVAPLGEAGPHRGMWHEVVVLDTHFRPKEAIKMKDAMPLATRHALTSDLKSGHYPQ